MNVKRSWVVLLFFGAAAGALAGEVTLTMSLVLLVGVVRCLYCPSQSAIERIFVCLLAAGFGVSDLLVRVPDRCALLVDGPFQNLSVARAGQLFRAPLSRARQIPTGRIVTYAKIECPESAAVGSAHEVHLVCDWSLPDSAESVRMFAAKNGSADPQQVIRKYLRTLLIAAFEKGLDCRQDVEQEVRDMLVEEMRDSGLAIHRFGIALMTES